MFGSLLALAVLIVGIVVLLPEDDEGTPGRSEKDRKGRLPAAVSAPFDAFSEGYDCFRIPTLTTTKGGHLLAIAEGRTKTCADVGDIDLVMKRSTDNGRTWGPLHVIRGADDPGGFGNPVPVVDSVSGRISLLYAYNSWSAGSAGERIRAPRELRISHSSDDGVTWSASLASLPELKEDDWEWVSVGPGHGIQLRPTEPGEPGRMVVTGDYRKRGNHTGAMLYYSDDGGLTWELGARWAAPEGTPTPAEPALTQLPDGRLYINARSTRICGTPDHRVSAVIEDVTASDFPAPGFLPVPNQPAPPVSGSLLQLPDGGPLLFSSPTRPGAEFSDRWTLAVRTSTDGGTTWSAKGAVVARDRAGYSDMTLLPSGEVGLLYETGNATSTGSLKYTAFAPAAIEPASEDLTPRHTSDETPNKNHALVHGDPQLVPRADGKAMSFDGSTDYLRLANCPDSLRISGGDFAVTAWVRFDGSSGRQPLVWGSGQNAPNRQFVIETVDGRLEARINTGSGPYSVTTRTAFGDDRWHHVVFQRLGRQLQLSVGGGAPVVTDLPADLGDFQPADAFTVFIGTQPDQKAFYAGAIDDLRIYGRSLTREDLAFLRSGAEVNRQQERLRLGFSTIW